MGCLPGHKDVSMVVDPGPGLLLVAGGSGRGVVKAGVVTDDLLVDEVELQPGMSVSFSGSAFEIEIAKLQSLHLRMLAWHCLSMV